MRSDWWPAARSAPAWRSKGYRLTTLFFVLAVVAGGVILHAVNASESTKHVGVTSSRGRIGRADRGGRRGCRSDGARSRRSPTRRPPRTRSRSGDLDALVTATSPELTVVVKDKLDPSLTPMFGSLAQQLALVAAVDRARRGPGPGRPARSRTAAPQVMRWSPTPAVDSGQVVAGYVAGILLFLSLMTAGQLVAQGVVEEKSSRVVELLLSTLRPWQLMAGKVLGIGIVGLTQVAATLGAGSATAFALGLVNTTTLDVGSTAAWALVWFVIGFASLRPGARRTRVTGIPAGGRGVGHRSGHGLDGDPVHHRDHHRPVGPAQPAGRLAVLRPVLLTAHHADPDRGGGRRRLGDPALPSACRWP